MGSQRSSVWLAEDLSILISRLTYHGLDGLSEEVFGRVDSPWGVFLKSSLGIGFFNKGKSNDKDWLPHDEYPYPNTRSGESNGRFAYYTADAGYDVLRSTNYKIGGFIGWAYYSQSSDSRGCVPLTNPQDICRIKPSDDRIAGSQDTQWNAPRIGLSAETMLTERWRLNADIAYLPWTDFKGRDNHLLRKVTTFSEQHGNGGGGVQVEGLLSYFVTNNGDVPGSVELLKRSALPTLSR